MDRGRPFVPWDIIKTKKEVRQEFDREALRLLKSSTDELRTALEDPHASVLTKMLAKEFLVSLTAGFSESLERILNRALGKPVDQIALAVQDTQELARKMLELSREDQIKLIESRLNELKSEKPNG